MINLILIHSVHILVIMCVNEVAGIVIRNIIFIWKSFFYNFSYRTDNGLVDIKTLLSTSETFSFNLKIPIFVDIFIYKYITLSLDVWSHACRVCVCLCCDCVGKWWWQRHVIINQRFNRALCIRGLGGHTLLDSIMLPLSIRVVYLICVHKWTFK